VSRVALTTWQIPFKKVRRHDVLFFRVWVFPPYVGSLPWILQLARPKQSIDANLISLPSPITHLACNNNNEENPFLIASDLCSVHPLQACGIFYASLGESASTEHASLSRDLNHTTKRLTCAQHSISTFILVAFYLYRTR
jgi:hypothetical protein